MNLQQLIERRATERAKLRAAKDGPKRARAYAALAWHYGKTVLILSAAAIVWVVWIVFSVVFGAFLSQNKVRGAIR
jgi:hypothetical protein